MHLRETAILALGELVVSGFVILGFFLSDIIFKTGFTYRVFTGALLGSAVTVINFLALSMSVNRQIDKYIELRGTREMTEEEAEKFTAEHSMRIQNAIRGSFIARTASMLAALIIAFLLDWFAPLATAIPLLAYRPILTISELIRRKYDKTPDPANFIDYSGNEEDNNDSEEKESDE